MSRTTTAVVGACLAALLAGCAQKRLLLVTQYADGSPRVAEMAAAIDTEFKLQNLPFQFQVFNMNLVGQPGEIWQDERAKLATVRIHAFDPDLVFVAGDRAAAVFAQRMLGTHVRMIFFDVKGDPARYRLAGSPQATGVVEVVPVKEALALMKELVPSARGAAVIADRSLEGDAIVAQIEKVTDPAIRVVEIRRAGTMEEWLAAVKDLQGKADVLCIAAYSGVLTGSSPGAFVPAAEVLRATARANRMPDFSFYIEAVGPDGVTAAVATPAAVQATLAARMGVRVLYQREKIANIRITSCEERVKVTSPERAAQLGIKLPEAPQPPQSK